MRKYSNDSKNAALAVWAAWDQGKFWEMHDLIFEKAPELDRSVLDQIARELGLDMSKTNVNGGAVALGHPLGCTGARLMVTLLHEMKRRAAAGERMRYGLATMCVGVGQGCATLVERPS